MLYDTTKMLVQQPDALPDSRNKSNKSFLLHFVNSIYLGQETECPEPLISPDHLARSPQL